MSFGPHLTKAFPSACLPNLSVRVVGDFHFLPLKGLSPNPPPVRHWGACGRPLSPELCSLNEPPGEMKPVVSAVRKGWLFGGLGARGIWGARRAGFCGLVMTV